MRQVLVKVAPGAKSVPSGTVTSLTNAIASQAGLTPEPPLPPLLALVAAMVWVTSGVSVAGCVAVGSGVKVAVGTSKAASVNWALTVEAAAVNTIEEEGVLLPGKLQAASRSDAIIARIH